MSLTHIKDGKGYWTVVIDNKPYQFNPSHPDYNNLVELVKKGDGTALVKALDKSTPVISWCGGDFNFTGGVLYYKQSEVNKVITDRILSMIDEGFDHKPMLAFLENLYKNPSYRAINELYTFLEHKHLPITPDGCFLAYKYVSVYEGSEITDLNGLVIKSGDFVDTHTKRSHRNNVGDKPSMPRHAVDDNLNEACGAGLHVGAIEYVRNYINIVICKINPADVVSIPLDHSCQKLRCCTYEVVGIYEKPFEKQVELYNQEDQDRNQEEDEEEDEEDFYDSYGDDEDEDEDYYGDDVDDEDEEFFNPDWQ